MSGTYIQYPAGGGSGSGVASYSSFAVFPNPPPAGVLLAIAEDTDTLYVYDIPTSSWLPVGGSSVPLNVGALNGAARTANGASIGSNSLFMQTATVTFPGLISTTSQSVAGGKTFQALTSSPSNLNIAAVLTDGSTSAFAVTDTGSVGIGISNPSSLFHVRGGSGDQVYVTDATGNNLVLSVNSANSIIYTTVNGIDLMPFSGAVRIDPTASNGSLAVINTASATQVLIQSAGDSYFQGGSVGIFTTTPPARLSVKSATNSTADYSFNIQNLSNTYQCGYGAYGISNRVGAAGNINYELDVGGTFTIRTNTAERVRVTNTGFVLIGTTSGNKSLQIYPTATAGPISLGTYNATYNGFWLNGSSLNGDYTMITGAGDQDLYINRPISRDIHFRENNGTDQIVLRSGGNLGIGVTVPTHMVDVSGVTSSNSNGLRVISDNGTGFLSTFIVRNQGISFTSTVASATPLLLITTPSSAATSPAIRVVGSSSIPILHVGSDARVGIGTLSPQTSFDVRGSTSSLANVIQYVIGSTNVQFSIGSLTAGSYSLRWPLAQGGVNTSFVNDGSGNLSFVSRSAFDTQTVGSITFSQTAGGNTYSLQWPAVQGSNSWVLSNNGAGAMSWAPALTNPMTTSGDLIVGSASGTAARFPGSTSNSVSFLAQVGSAGVALPPVWTPFRPPTITTITTPGGPATYNPPAGSRYRRVRLIGGGGSGGTNLADGVAGSQTTFASLVGGAGAGGGTAGALAAGGTASGGNIANIPGGGGQAGSNNAIGSGGQGGCGPFGGGGAGGGSSSTSGQSGATNSGAGGGGGAATSCRAGGGAGGYVEHFFYTSSSAYTYTLGAGGPGPSGAGSGAAGIIIIEEYYQ